MIENGIKGKSLIITDCWSLNFSLIQYYILELHMLWNK